MYIIFNLYHFSTCISIFRMDNFPLCGRLMNLTKKSLQTDKCFLEIDNSLNRMSKKVKQTFVIEQHAAPNIDFPKELLLLLQQNRSIQSLNWTPKVKFDFFLNCSLFNTIYNI